MRWLGLLFGLAAFGVTAPAAAIELSWEAPDTCPDRPNVEQRIQKLVGPSKTEVTPPTVEARITPTKGGYHLELTTTRDGIRGVRALDDASCEALAESAALIVAMAIDPAAALALESPEEPPPSPSPLIATPSPNELPPAAAEIVAAPPADAPSSAASEPPRGEPLRPRFLLSAGGEVHGMIFPRAALGAAMSFGAILGAFRFDLGGRYTPSREHELTAPSGASGTFDLLVGTARGAYLVTRDNWDFGPTVGLEAGRARGRGHGVSTSLEGSAPWFAGTFGALATVRLGALALTTELSLIAPLTRPSFVIEGAGTVHTPGAIALRAGLSAEVRF